MEVKLDKFVNLNRLQSITVQMANEYSELYEIVFEIGNSLYETSTVFHSREDAIKALRTELSYWAMEKNPK